MPNVLQQGMSIYTDPFSNHAEGGEYITWKELKKAGFTKVKDHGTTYYLEAGAKDEPENRFFEKKDHHGHSYATDAKKKQFKANDPYLITYSHKSHMYEYGAIKTTDEPVI